MLVSLVLQVSYNVWQVCLCLKATEEDNIERILVQTSYKKTAPEILS